MFVVELYNTANKLHWKLKKESENTDETTCQYRWHLALVGYVDVNLLYEFVNDLANDLHVVDVDFDLMVMSIIQDFLLV